MVETRKAAVLIVMACIIAPMLVGYAWPDDKVERIGWESGDGHDITSSIKTSSIPTYAMDRTVISPAWSESSTGYTETYTGVITPPSNLQRVELSQWIINNVGFVDLQSLIEESEGNGAQITASVSIESEPSPPLAPRAPSALIPTSIVTPSESTSWTDMGILSSASCSWDAGELYVWNANGWTISDSTPAWDSRDILVQNVQDSNFTYRINISYYVPSESEPIIQMRLSAPSIGGKIAVGLTNVQTSTISVHNADDSVQFLTIIDQNGVISGRIVTDDSTTDIAAIGTTSTISWVLWSWDSVADKVTFSTMTGAIGSGSPFESRTYDVPIYNPVSSWYAEVSTSSGWKPQIMTYDNLVKAGSTLGILNATIRGNEYYPDGSWQITIKAPSTIGNTISIAGQLYSIVGGDIVVDGEEIPIRNTTVFAAGNGDGTSNVYINGIRIATNVSNPTITLGGTWNATIILNDMNSYTYWTYTKDAGGFGLDVVGFCTVGLVTSIGAFLGAVIAGKRSGGRFGLLALVAGICAAFFLLMISNNLNL